MRSHEVTLLDPSPADLTAAVSAAIRNGNKGCRKNRLPDPPPDYDDFVARHAGQREGTHSWQSDPDPLSSASTRLAVVWWTDRGGRRHYRLACTRGHSGFCWRLSDVLANGAGMWEARNWPPLLRLDRCAFERTIGDRTEVVVLCDCGVLGTPSALGWMGGRCGPCHDRVEGGEPLPPRGAWLWEGQPWDARSLAFAPGGALLAAGGSEALRLFTVDTGSVRQLPIDRGENLSVAFSPDGKTLAVGRKHGVWLLDPASGRFKALGRLTAPHRNQVCDLQFGPRENRLFGREDDHLCWWDVTTGACDYPSTSTAIKRFALSPDGRTVAATARYGVAQILLLAPEEGWAPRGPIADPRAGELAFSPDGRTLAALTYDYPHRVALFETETGRLLREHPVVTRGAGSSGAVAFTPDGRTLLTAIEETITGWDVASGKSLVRVCFPDESFHTLALSPAGTHLAWGSMTGVIRLLPLELLRAG